MTPVRQSITASLEDYLEAIWDLGGSARCSDIARRLGVAKASVTAAAQKLRARGLAAYERYGRVALTAPGRARAEAIRRRHDDLVTFLVSVLGVPRAVAEQDACVLEHGLSRETAGRLTFYVEKQLAAAKRRRQGVKKREE